MVTAPEPARVRAVMVTFEPGARTAWHTHPLGQTLHVLSGAGLAQIWGGPGRRSGPATPCGFRRGRSTGTAATPTVAMTHLAIHEALDGAHVDWLEQVSDAQYNAA